MSLNGTTRILIVGFVVLILLTNSNPLALAAGPGVAMSESQELQTQLNLIKSFGISRDLAGLESFVEKNISAWEKMDMDNYGNLMLTVVQMLGSEPFKDRQQYILARRYARHTLEKAGHIPLEVELKLVRHIEVDLITHSIPHDRWWAEQRTADMKLWFQAWKRLNDSIDPNWDPNDLPQSKVTPPLAANLPAGVVPEAIKDTRLRTEYEAAIEANRQKSEFYNQQYHARKLKKQFLPKAERYIISAYSYPPFDLEELQKYLYQYVENELTRKRIIEATRIKMGLGVE